MVADPKKIVLAVIHVNIGMFLISLLASGENIGLDMNPFSALSPSNNSILILGATGTFPIDRFFSWWTPLSAVYLHGSALHILFNMLMFHQFSSLAIKTYGLSRMFTIYTIGGILGNVVSYFSGTYLTIGASGAVCALAGSLLYYGKSRGGQYGQALYRQLFGWVITLVVFGFLVPQIDNWAHGGGLASGIALGWLLGYKEKVRERALHKTIGMICILVTACVLFWALGSGIWIQVIN